MNYLLNLVIPYNVGDITQKRMEALKRCFSTKYPNGFLLPGQFIMTNNTLTISVMPNQIIFSGPDRDFDETSSEVGTIFDTLLLNDELQSIIIDLQQQKDFSSNFMEYTKNNYTNIISDSIGTGLRNFFLVNNRLCEFKIEPLLTDYNKIFIQGIYNYSNLNIHDIKNLLNNSYDDYTNKISGIL